MNVLGINPGHNGSACVISNGKVVHYIEEERLSKNKWDGYPILSLHDIYNRFSIDHLVIAGTTNHYPIADYSRNDYYASIHLKYNKNKGSIIYTGHLHHQTHAALAFYNSGFKNATAVVIDGCGAEQNIRHKNHELTGLETESIFECSYPCKFVPVYQSLVNNKASSLLNLENYQVGSNMTITKCYEAVADYLGFKFVEGGKVMGLSSYGKKNNQIPKLLNDYGRGSKDIFISQIPSGALIDKQTNPIFNKQANPEEWHHDPSKITDIEKDIAYAIQIETQEAVKNLIQKAIDLTKENNIVLSGGYFLNCVTNYFLQKHFPKINFYVEPISHDGGTAIGAAKMVFHEKTASTKIIPQQSLYYGKKYSKKKILKTIEKYV